MVYTERTHSYSEPLTAIEKAEFSADVAVDKDTEDYNESAWEDFKYYSTCVQQEEKRCVNVGLPLSIKYVGLACAAQKGTFIKLNLDHILICWGSKFKAVLNIYSVLLISETLKWTGTEDILLSAGRLALLLI